MKDSPTVVIPGDVPDHMSSTFMHNYLTATQASNRLMLFAGDQKIEHLNDDFYGPGIAPDDASPEHLFRIASRANVGVFAAQLGLIARYALDYPPVPLLVKLNSKTHLVKTKQKDPLSRQLHTVSQVVKFARQTRLPVVGIGMTVYFGSEYEAEMLQQAAQAIYQAHQAGMLAVIWAYPRGQAVKDEKDPHLIAGAAGAAAALGADFVKVNFPKSKQPLEDLKEAVQAAGNTKLVCAGGSSQPPKQFLKQLYDQIHVSGAAGNATGRNIHQKPLDQAIRFCNAISAITLDNATVEEAWKIYQTKTKSKR